MRKKGRIFRPLPRRTDVPAVIDLGTPMHMVGHTGFVPLAGGGRCKKCQLLFANLLQNSMCAGCAGNEDEPPTGLLPPLSGKPR